MTALKPATASPPGPPPAVSPRSGGDIVALRKKFRGAPEKPPLKTRFIEGTKAFADGTFRVGPKHTWHAIKAKPVQYAFLLAGGGALGAGLMAAGVDPEPYAIGFSAAVCGWSAWKGLPELRTLEGADRLRSIGANVLWPASLAVGTSALGLLLGHDTHSVVPTAGDIAKAGAQSIVIGADVPTIVQTVLDVPEGAREKRRFRRWLFGHHW